MRRMAYYVFSNDSHFFRFAVMRVNEEAEKEEDDGLDICLNNPGTDILHTLKYSVPLPYLVPGFINEVRTVNVGEFRSVDADLPFNLLLTEIRIVSECIPITFRSLHKFSFTF
jgi:hypothetical protein